MMSTMRRFWRYRYGSWTPQWWFYLVPYRGGDEYGRLTLVMPVHPFGFLVVAYRTCRCVECDESRAQTAEWEAERLELEKA